MPADFLTFKFFSMNIQIHQLELNLFLGVTQAEQLQKQLIMLDIDIHFEKPPKACLTDNIADTYCYDALVQCIQLHIASRPFHLLEHLAYSIYQEIKQSIDPIQPASIRVQVTKKPVLALPVNSVSVCYEDSF